MRANKNTFLIILLMTWSLFSFAQDALTPGNRIVGGGLSFGLHDSENLDEYNNFNQLETRKNSFFNFSPYYGRLYDDNKMIGISLLVGTSNRDYIRSDNDFPSTYNSDETRFGAGVFLRNYFPITEKAGIFIQPGVNYERIIRDDVAFWFTDSTFLTVEDRRITQTKSNLFSMNLKVGLYVFLLEQLSIESNLGSFVASMGKNKYVSEYYFSNSSTPVSTSVNKNDSSSISLNLINQFTFDQIFTINYYF